MVDPISRRALLTSIGTAAATGVAGCLSGLPHRDRIDEDGLPPATVATTSFRGGFERQGVLPDATVPESATIEWAIRDVNVGDHTAAKASPVVVPGGDIVVPGDSGTVYRVTPDGETVWTAAVEETSRGIHGTPAVANGAVYIGAYDGAMYAFDLDSGERFWRQALGDAIGSSPGYHDGVVYIAVEYYEPSGAMMGLDAVTGEVVWEDDRPTDHPHSTAALDLDVGRLVVGSNDGKLYAWNYPELEFEWAFETGDAIKGPVAIGNGLGVFGSWDDTVYAVDLTNGTESWSVDVDAKVMSGPSIDPETDTVYIGSHNSNLYALDLETGEEDWRFSTGGAIIGCPMVTSDHVLVGSYDRHCYAVEKGSGQQAWRVRGVGRMTGTPTVADGAVYVTDRASRAYLEDGSGKSGALYKIADDSGG